MKKYFESLPENIKETTKVVFPLIVIVFLFFLVGKFGVSKIIEVRGKINQSKEIENILTEKLSVLQSVSESFSQGVNLVTLALPEGNPAITAVSQLKNIALKNSVAIASIKSGGSDGGTSGLPFANTTFQVTGPRSGILGFLKNVEEMAPLSKVDKVRISENGGITLANVTVKTYWSAYPKTIPTITQPVANITSSEKQIIGQLTGLIQPTFSNVQPSSGGTSGEISNSPFGE